MIFLAYFLEYISITAIASQITKDYKQRYPVQTPTMILYLFEIINLAYQCGVFATRSTLDLIKIKKVHFITLILFVFSTLIFVQSLVHHDWGVGWVIANIVCVGFFGGLAFGNIYYMMLELKTILKSEREILINIIGIFSDLGIIASSLVGLVLKSFIYPA